MSIWLAAQMTSGHLGLTFRLSGSSVRPAYPGFMVMNTPQLGSTRNSRPSSRQRSVPLRNAACSASSCWAMTLNTCRAAQQMLAHGAACVCCTIT